MLRKLSLFSVILLAGLLVPAISVADTNKKFTVVLDAGHGGQDPGAIGSTAREKDLNLAVSLKVGRLITSEFDDVNVLYTRKNDTFLKLQERADFVNKNNADLFICIHTNSAENRAVVGAETFTLGLDKVESNLDVAMRENAVILLEDNYKTTYQGFNPNSVESYIMFEFMQDQYIDRSLQFASLVQNNLAGTYNRNDRGVRQAAFWVLHKSACPSVLIEMGFISNREEERYLISEKGQNEIATAIYKAFANYKREVDKKSGKTAIETTENDSTANIQVTYKVQIFSVKKLLKKGDSAFKGLKNVDYFQENNYYKYTCGATSDYNEVLETCKEVQKKFHDAFVIAFFDGKRISVKDAQKIQTSK